MHHHVPVRLLSPARSLLSLFITRAYGGSARAALLRPRVRRLTARELHTHTHTQTRTHARAVALQRFSFQLRDSRAAQMRVYLAVITGSDSDVFHTDRGTDLVLSLNFSTVI